MKWHMMAGARTRPGLCTHCRVAVHGRDVRGVETVHIEPELRRMAEEDEDVFRAGADVFHYMVGAPVDLVLDGALRATKLSCRSGQGPYRREISEECSR